MLAWMEGASLREIAQAVGMTHSGVSRLLTRASMREQPGAIGELGELDDRSAPVGDRDAPVGADG